MTTDNDSYHATSIASWSLAVANALALYDYDADDVFRDAGIALKAIKSPHSRLHVSRVQKVWKFAYENTDECFGVNVSRFLKPASLHALGFGLHSSSTIKELLQRLIRYRCVISHMFFAELIEQDDNYLFTTVDKRTVKTNITHDALFAYLLRLAREVQAPDFSPLLVKLARTPTRSTKKLAEFMAAPVRFGEPECSMLFSREQLERPLSHGNSELAAKQDVLIEQYIAELGLISEYMLRVKAEITRLLQRGEVSVNLVAENLNVTVRTLQRRLADEKSSYHNLLDKVRYKLALDYVSNPSVSATEIAFKLGFNDSGSFSRSFKRWTSQSFSEYRNSHRIGL